jgi:hypothetical protein
MPIGRRFNRLQFEWLFVVLGRVERRPVCLTITGIGTDETRHSRMHNGDMRVTRSAIVQFMTTHSVAAAAAHRQSEERQAAQRPGVLQWWCRVHGRV